MNALRRTPGIAAALLAAGTCCGGTPAAPRDLAPPVTEGRWVQPAPGETSQPVWGVKDGIAVGLWPTPGPRGLVRIYAPYLGHGPLRMINFVAVEPVVGRARGLSELEPSALDGVPGKAMWTGDAMDDDPQPHAPWNPTRGRIIQVDGVEALTFFVFVEPFRNGARPVVQIVLRSDRPREVGFRLFAAKGSAAMRTCVLTATMGNYARLRHLWLKGEVVASTRLWPNPPLNRHGFTGHREWGLDRVLVVDGEAIAAATPDEAQPDQASYAASVARHWRYQGKGATQYWRAPAAKGLVVRVNGRTAYWASQAPIPGGIAYENFELAAPFEDGQRFAFGVTPDPPESLGFDRAWRGKLTDGR